MHASAIMGLLLDISRRLQATGYNIQSRQKLDTEAVALSEGAEPGRSQCHKAAAHASRPAFSPLHGWEATIADLSEDVRASVARRLPTAPILTISTPEEDSESEA